MSIESDSSERSNSPVDDKSKDPTVKYYVKVEPESSRTSRSSASSRSVSKSSPIAVRSAKSQIKLKAAVLTKPTAVGQGKSNLKITGPAPVSPSGPAPQNLVSPGGSDTRAPDPCHRWRVLAT